MRFEAPTLLLYIFLTITQFCIGVYIASGLEPPALFQLLYPVSFFWIIGWWLWSDSKKRGIPWVYDMGFFLYLAWPFVMPYYLIKSRGVRGALAIIAFVVAYAAALVIGIGSYIVLAPTDWPSILRDSP